MNYEYEVKHVTKVLGGYEKALRKELNGMGAQGWEFVQVVPWGNGLQSFLVVFRRPRD